MPIIRKKTEESFHKDIVDTLELEFQQYNDKKFRNALFVYLVRYGLIHALINVDYSRIISFLINPKYITNRIQTHRTADIHDFLTELNYLSEKISNPFVSYFCRWFLVNIHLMIRATDNWPMIKIFIQKIREDEFLKPFFTDFGVGVSLVEKYGVEEPFTQQRILDRYVDLEYSSVYIHGSYILAWRPGAFGCARGNKKIWSISKSIRRVYVDAKDDVYAEIDSSNKSVVRLNIHTDLDIEIIKETRLIGGYDGQPIFVQNQILSWGDISFVLPESSEEVSVTISDYGYVYYIYGKKLRSVLVIDLKKHVRHTPYALMGRYCIASHGLIVLNKDKTEICSLITPNNKHVWNVSELAFGYSLSNISSVKDGFIITLKSDTEQSDRFYLIRGGNIRLLPMEVGDCLRIYSSSMVAWINRAKKRIYIWNDNCVIETEFVFEVNRVQKSKFHEGFLAIGSRKIASISKDGQVEQVAVLGKPITQIFTKVEEISEDEFVWWDATRDPWEIVMFRMRGELTNYYLASRSVNSVHWSTCLTMEEHQRYISKKEQQQEKLKAFTHHMYRVYLELEDDTITAYRYTFDDSDAERELVWTIKYEEEEEYSMYILDGNYLLVSDDFGCSLYWQDGDSVQEVFYTDNICEIDFGLILYGQKLIFVTEDFMEMESRSLLLNVHGDNDAFADSLYELEKWYPELTPIRQGSHSTNNESRGGVWGMFGLTGTLYLEQHNQFPLFEISTETTEIARWETEWLVVPYRVLDDKYVLVTIGKEYKLLEIQQTKKGWSTQMVTINSES